MVMVKCICEWCKNEYEIERWIANRGQRFCSKSCRMSWQMTKPPVYVNCDNCKIEIKIRPYKKNNIRHFCSRKCQYEYFKKYKIGITSEESVKNRAKAKLGKKRKPFTEEHKMHIGDAERGEKHWNWRGGISKKYCNKFNKKFKEYIRYKFNNRCYICGKNDNKRRLSIHHIDYNKNSICNGKEWAFVPLCTSCHVKTNNNRWYWFNLLINYWAMNSDILI